MNLISGENGLMISMLLRCSYRFYFLWKQTLAIELKRLGWQKTKRAYHAPEITKQHSSNEQLRDILNHKQYSATPFDISIPVFA